MRPGIAYGVVERGLGEDAGRLRVTFRYRARTWAAIIEADGTLDDTEVSVRFRRHVTE